MCFGKYKRKNSRIRYKINKIVPFTDTIVSMDYHNKIKEEHSFKSRESIKFHDEFIKEIIPCGFCNEKFNLGSNELQINCGGCDKFFHCHIGGKCRGDDCCIQMPTGEIERISYCLNCCDSYTAKNGYCICNKCK